MEPVRFRADEILYAQSTLTPNCAASCAKAPLPASYAPRSFCRRSLLYAFAISTTSTNAKRLQRISLYTFWKFALSRLLLAQTMQRPQPPNQIHRMYPHNLALRKASSDDIQRDPVIRIVERRHQHQSV